MNNTAQANALDLSVSATQKPEVARRASWAERLFWIGMVGAWAVWLPNLLRIDTLVGYHSPLFLLSPIFGLVALGAGIRLKSWWRIPVALLLGVGAPWVIITVGYLVEAMTH